VAASVICAVVKEERIVPVNRKSPLRILWRDGACLAAVAGQARSAVPVKAFLLE
jgi:hypothetical protein